MRRFVFYVLVTLLTFGIGSFFAFKFYQKNSKRFSEIKSSSNTESMISKFEIDNEAIKEIPLKPDEKGNLICTDKEILPIWNDLKKDEVFTFFTDKLAVDVNCKEVLKIVRLDLNNDKEKELIVTGESSKLCDFGANCGFWIYQRKGDQYRKLLSDTSYSDDPKKEKKPTQIQKSRTKAFLDVLLEEHISGYETGFRIYKFNGQKYIETNCIIEEYDFNDEINTLNCE